LCFGINRLSQIDDWKHSAFLLSKVPTGQMSNRNNSDFPIVLWIKFCKSLGTGNLNQPRHDTDGSNLDRHSITYDNSKGPFGPAVRACNKSCEFWNAQAVSAVTIVIITTTAAAATMTKRRLPNKPCEDCRANPLIDDIVLIVSATTISIRKPRKRMA
jgi:hypothetical protein